MAMSKRKAPLREGSKAEQAMDKRHGVKEDSAADKRLDKKMGVLPAKKKHGGK